MLVPMIMSVSVLAAETPATEHFVATGDSYELGERANWGRVFPKDDGDGYWFLVAAAGDYLLQSMTSDFELEGSRSGLTGFDYLVDHAVTRCPDGTWLHFASANLDDYDDSVYAFRYTADWELSSWTTLVERDSTTSYNDAPALCTGDLDGSPFQSRDNRTNYLLEIDEDTNLVDSWAFGGLPAVGGSSLVQEDDGSVVFIRSWYRDNTLLIERYSDPSVWEEGELVLLESWEPEVADEGLVAYWPQGLTRVGDRWVLANVARDNSLSWVADSGDIYLQVFDLDWTLLETLQVTDFGGGQGAMQPFLNYVEGTDELLLLFDVDVQPTLTPITIEPTSFGFDLDLNQAPVADAGLDLDLVLGDEASLDGSGSSDPDGDSLSFSWAFSSVPAGSALDGELLDSGAGGSGAGDSAAAVSFTPDVVGSYVAVLTVDDGLDVAEDSVVVTVSDPGGDGDGGAVDDGTETGDGGAETGDVGDGSDVDSTQGDDAKAGCSAVGAPASLAMLLLPLVGLVRRRRS